MQKKTNSVVGSYFFENDVDQPSPPTTILHVDDYKLLLPILVSKSRR